MAGAAALLVTALMAAAATEAQAASAGPARSSTSLVTVLSGDSLWSVAVRAAPNADARIVIQEIIQLNHVSGTLIYPGEQLRVPRN